MIAQNVKHIIEKVDLCCQKNGRKNTDVMLIAVSKNFGVDEIREVHQASLVNFGENKAQELESKFNILGNMVNWHFIGHLQVNKVKYVAKSAGVIHSVDSFKVADEINKRAASLDKVQNILLEIKTSDEASKFGLTDENEIIKLAEHCAVSPNLKLLGLMTIAPFTDDEKLIRKSFSGLRDLKDRLNTRGHNLTELSMGMTHDFEIAIEEGSTMLRIGTAIFGERNYN
jgi:pyridoxal phosphate enzyme (YggS family)